MQRSLGVKDKDGVLIYEGDAVKYKGKVQIVLIEKLEITDEEYSKFGASKIIGNVCENEKLLKQ